MPMIEIITTLTFPTTGISRGIEITTKIIAKDASVAQMINIHIMDEAVATMASAVNMVKTVAVVLGQTATTVDIARLATGTIDMIGTVAKAAGPTVHRQAAVEADLVAANVVGVAEADPTVETGTTTGLVDHTVIEIPVRTSASAR